MDGPPPQEEDFSSLTISERLNHKNWKARVSGYESLIKTFQTTASDSDPAFKPYVNNPDLLKKIATDSNAVAQEKGVECLVALIKFAGETAAKSRETVVPALVDKCLGSARAGTKNQAIELILQYVEVENSAAGVVADIIPGLSAKQPKTVTGSVFALKEVVRIFGTQVTPPAPVLKTLPKIFAHADKNVRLEGTHLTHTLYRYIGPAIDPWLAELKPVQVKELQEAFEGMEKTGQGKGTLKSERLTREQQREAEIAGDAADEGEAGAGDQPEELDLPDPRTLAEPVDIVPKLPSNMQANLTSSKWKERKEVLDELLTLVNATPRIQDAPELAELTKSLATCISKDANINCVMVAAQIIEGLAKGIMSPFGRLREAIIPLMLERLKERKANVTDAIGAALDAVFSTTNLPDTIPDLIPALGNKNPQIKEGTLKFLARSLSTSTTPVQTGQIKTLADPLAVLLEDGSEGARNEAAVCLGLLMKMVGERPLNALMDGLADVRKAKVKEAYEKATVKCKVGAGGPAKGPAAKEPLKKKAPPPKMAGASKAEVADVLMVDEEPPKKPLGKPPARLMKKAPPPDSAEVGPSAGGPPAKAAPAVKKLAPTTAAKPSKPSAPTAPGALDTFKYKHTPEDAEGLAAELIPASIMEGLADANWKARLAACEEMHTWIEGVVEDVDAEVVVRAIAKKGWSEKNFQVSAKLYGILTILAERCPSFGRSCVVLSTSHLSEKLGDMKLKKPAGESLTAFAEKTSLQFVLNQAYDPLGKQKAPKVLADALGWIDTAIIEFGIAGVSLRPLIEFLKTALKNSNAAVRTSATKTLVSVKLFAGSSIKDFLEDLNAQLLVTIQGEFDKVEGTPAPEPCRTSADVAALAPATGGGTIKGPDPLDDLFPRVEIDGLLKGTTILADSKSDAWKSRKEALETLQALLDQGANKRLKPSIGEIAQVLKARVLDTNKAVQSLALDIVARIATGMGKPFEKQNKLFVVPVATVLSDQKAPIRAAAIQTLTAMATASEGLDSMVHFLGTALEATNPTQRASLLGWIADFLKDHPPSSPLDLGSWAGTVVSCLDDRSADMRKGAQALLPHLIASVGFDKVMQHTNSLKPASRKTAVPIIQAARDSAAPPPAALPSAPTPVKAAASKVIPPVSADLPPAPPSPSSPVAASMNASKLTGVRRKLPQGTNSRPDSRADSVDEPTTSRLPGKLGIGGIKRATPASIATKSSAALSPAAVSALPFTSMNTEAKRARLAKDVQRWINEGGTTRKDLADLLQHQMEPHASKDLVAQLFSHDHNAVNDHVSGLTTMHDFFSAAESGDDKFGVSPDDLRAVALACSDLALKYVSIKVHEPQSNLIAKCLEVVESVVAFLRCIDAQIDDSEALCFLPTLIHKLGDAREPVRARVQQIIQTMPKVFAFSRVFDLLLEHGLKSKVAKTRQGALDEIGNLLKRNGMSACNQPSKALPVVGSMIADKDSAVRKSALSALGEVYSLIGEKVWSLVGPLSPKDKTQLEERLRRVAGPSSPGKPEPQTPVQSAQISRLAAGTRPDSPSRSIAPRPASPAISSISRIARPGSPARTLRSASPAPSQMGRPSSPMRLKTPGQFGISVPSATAGSSSVAAPSSPSGLRPKSFLPSRLGPPKPRPNFSAPPSNVAPRQEEPSELPYVSNANGRSDTGTPSIPSMESGETLVDTAPTYDDAPAFGTPDDITITISSILSSDPSRSVDALKKIQRILITKPEDGHASLEYRELAEHTEGLIETITLQMAHVFERPEDLVSDENFRLAKHLIQTLNTFCDHIFLAESLTVDILNPLLEELTLRLLETDESHISKVKDLSRFINMIILRLFATGRRMSIFRALFALLLQIVKPFPSNGTLSDSKEARVAELVLKCVWKLARNIPQDLKEQKLDPVELLPAVEHFLQSVPPNEWRARATNKVPCGDMPLRTIKVIIQHVVAQYGDDVYDFLSASFDDPSATIVYPYVYRILNSSSRAAAADLPMRSNHSSPSEPVGRPYSAASSRPISPAGSSAHHRQSSPSHRTSPSVSSQNGFSPPAEEPDPEAQLITIINHISSETTGAMHKEGITELHQFLKNYPHKRPRVEKLLETTGPAFRKYINRALASRAAEDLERDVAVASTLSKLEANGHESPPMPSSPVPSRGDMSPRSAAHHLSDPPGEDRLHQLHGIFHYNRASTLSNGSSQGAAKPRVSES